MKAKKIEKKPIDTFALKDGCHIGLSAFLR